jgi:hypothetical protein
MHFTYIPPHPLGAPPISPQTHASIEFPAFSGRSTEEKRGNPELDLRTFRPKEHRERNSGFRPGEVPRFILDTLRQSATPLSCQTLAERAVATKGLANTPETVGVLSARACMPG